ncbi:MAG: chemotaxis protein CheX [Candidatus Auribacterota bacterium]
MLNNHENYLDQFTSAFKKNIMVMTGLTCELSEPRPQSITFASSGLAVIIGVTGTRPGIIILDTSREIARSLCELIDGEEYSLEDEFVLYTIAEFANVVSGHAISLISDLYVGLHLDITPPSIFSGEKLKITSPKIKPEVIEATTLIGKIYITLGLEKSI